MFWLINKLMFTSLGVGFRCVTEPFAAVQLHPHAHVHGVIRDGHEAHEASDDGRLQVLEHDVVGVPVPFDHLQVRGSPIRQEDGERSKVKGGRSDRPACPACSSTRSSGSRRGCT